jgi:hypothetical protein
MTFQTDVFYQSFEQKVFRNSIYQLLPFNQDV